MQNSAAPLIAAHYLPSRYHYWYARSKLASDPLYCAAVEVLASTQAAILDVGCGIGLLAQALRASGVELPYRGVDTDRQKIEIAARAAASSSLTDTQFESNDPSREFPAHRGSVVLLDVLQYFSLRVRDAMLVNAAQCISPNGCLLLRVGLDDGSWRARLTRAADGFGHAIRWMQTPPQSQFTRAELDSLLTAQQLKAEYHPLWGRTPFNNWLVIARR
jgi:2-polyprenyl-3-methyl-5-hydroxy-6-metoxy-1,4-benzoquinol methylase